MAWFPGRSDIDCSPRTYFLYGIRDAQFSDALTSRNSGRLLDCRLWDVWDL